MSRIILCRILGHKWYHGASVHRCWRCKTIYFTDPFNSPDIPYEPTRYPVSDREALVIADQHDIQTRLK